MQGADNFLKKNQVQKVYLMDCIHIPKFGLCWPHYNFKIDIQYSSNQSKFCIHCNICHSPKKKYIYKIK